MKEVTRVPATGWEAAGICWALVRASIRGEMQYRANFLIEVAFGLVYQTLGFVFVWVVLGQFESLGGWSLNEVTLLYGIQLSGHALWALAFTRMLAIDEMVRQGDFDQMLLRPLPTMLQFMFGGFRIATLGDVAGAAVLLSVGLANTNIDWSPAKVIFLVLAIVASGMVKGAFQLGPASITFRFLDSNMVRYFFDRTMRQFGTFPLDIFERQLRWFLTFVIPAAFLAWIPASVLLDRTGELPFPGWVAWCTPLAGPGLLALAYRIFTNELRHYQSSGS
jgi:ABC-2 type transport system permease protein